MSHPRRTLKAWRTPPLGIPSTSTPRSGRPSGFDEGSTLTEQAVASAVAQRTGLADLSPAGVAALVMVALALQQSLGAELDHTEVWWGRIENRVFTTAASLVPLPNSQGALERVAGILGIPKMPGMDEIRPRTAIRKRLPAVQRSSVEGGARRPQTSTSLKSIPPEARDAILTLVARGRADLGTLTSSSQSTAAVRAAVVAGLLVIRAGRRVGITARGALRYEEMHGLPALWGLVVVSRRGREVAVPVLIAAQLRAGV